MFSEFWKKISEVIFRKKFRTTVSMFFNEIILHSENPLKDTENFISKIDV